MATYTTTIRTPRRPDAAFAYVADLRNLADWDPSVSASPQVRGDGPALDAECDVTVDATPGRPVTLRYRTIAFDAPHTATVRARSRFLTSVDRIDVVPDGDGARVTYDARLTLNGPLSLFDRVLQRAFRTIGERGAAGLTAALEGERA